MHTSQCFFLLNSFLPLEQLEKTMFISMLSYLSIAINCFGLKGNKIIPMIIFKWTVLKLRVSYGTGCLYFSTFIQVIEIQSPIYEISSNLIWNRKNILRNRSQQNLLQMPYKSLTAKSFIKYVRTCQEWGFLNLVLDCFLYID